MPPNTNTEIALIKQAMDFQNKEISEIKKILLEFIDSANKNFVTKEELKPIQEKQKDHDYIIQRVVWGIVIAFLSLTASLIGLSKYM